MGYSHPLQEAKKKSAIKPAQALAKKRTRAGWFHETIPARFPCISNSSLLRFPKRKKGRESDDIQLSPFQNCSFAQMAKKYPDQSGWRGAAGITHALAGDCSAVRSKKTVASQSQTDWQLLDHSNS